jgi:hypothetical protein
MGKHSIAKLIKYLYGIDSSCKHSAVFDSRRNKILPVNSSPIKEYINDVNRFLFAGGINVDLDKSLQDSPHQLLIEESLRVNKFNSILESLWKYLAITGEVLILVRFKDGLPYFEYFEKENFKPTYVGNELTEVLIKELIEIDEELYEYRLKINRQFYVEYPLVLADQADRYDWDANQELIDHPYGVTPGVIIQNTKDIKNSLRSTSEFSYSDIRLAISIITMEYGLDENVYFFGNPLIDSPDPERTIKALNNLSQVLEKLPNEDGGGHTLLQPQPLTSTELDYLKYKKESFRRNLGVTSPYETKLTDVSGVALRIMNDGLISRAQSKWQTIVEDGFSSLFQLILTMASRLNLVSDLGKVDFSINRIKPYFEQTSKEKIESLEVARQLIELGIDRSEALRETYYTNLSLEEIEEKLRPTMDDL